MAAKPLRHGAFSVNAEQLKKRLVIGPTSLLWAERVNEKHGCGSAEPLAFNESRHGTVKKLIANGTAYFGRQAKRS